jgi:cell division protein FtsI/penicillin-binding protein 2
MSFVGYFPCDAPQYSIYVELYKKEKPASGSYAAILFKDIAEHIVDASPKTD